MRRWHSGRDGPPSVLLVRGVGVEPGQPVAGRRHVRAHSQDAGGAPLGQGGGAVFQPFGQADGVHTWTAEDNDAMHAVNKRLGFRPVETMYQLERELD